MPSTGSGPGKTAPKLLHDFLHFDPLRSPPNSNYLTDLTPPVGEGVQLSPSPGSCKHDFTPKWPQSVAPPLDSRPHSGAEYKIATICKKCRVHADVHILHSFAVNPCPNEDYPLHHFQRHQAGDFSGQDRIVFGWICSAPECGAQLRISFRRPRFEPAAKDLLTDTERLRRRYEAVVADDPSREGTRQATPIEALGRLRRYIRDALNPEHEKRRFPANNKRFMEAFGVQGQDCASVLTDLGFQYTDYQWTLPQPQVLDNRLRADGDSLRERLEDIEMELIAWCSILAAENHVANPFAGEGWASADRDFERLLAAQGYIRHVALRRTGVSNEELPYFASLGVLPDFADSLIEFAFDRQSLYDPERRPYYFECLQVLAENRNTEHLQMKVATLASQDLVSRRDLNAAFRTLQISPAEASQASDDRILNLYHVLISDAGPAAQDEARQALYKIGLAKGSHQLVKAAQQTMETYEDALSWLGNGVDKTTSDDMLLSVVAIKTTDSKDNEELAQKAISIIAKERKSNTLNTWLLTGRSDDYQMSPDEALRHLGVDGNFSEIDPYVLPTTFDLARQDRPGPQTDKAIAALQQAISGGSLASHPLESWPVGLESHGNTCYLNSLLQYYFSVAPLRNIVLNYDDYKLDTSKCTEKRERVGMLNISMVEIKGGQRFAEDLKHLFERMIKSPTDKVRPEQDLVCRAFLDPKDYALMASAIKDEESARGTQTNGVENAVDDKVPEDDRHQSDASSVTLQAESNDGDVKDVPMKDADLPPTPPDSGGEDKEQKSTDAPPLPPRRFSSTREQALAIAQTKATQQQDVSDVHEKILWRLQAGMTPQGHDDVNEQKDAIRDLFEIGINKVPVENEVEGTPKHAFQTSLYLPGFTEDTDTYAMLDDMTDLQEAERATFGREGVQAYKSITSLPPLLQINIPRTVQNAEGKIYKSTACIKLEDELYMDRYCEQSGREVLQKRKACWGWRKQLHALRKEKKALSSCMADLDGPSAVAEAANYLNDLPGVNGELESLGMDGIDVDPELSAALAADAEEQKNRIVAIDNDIKRLEEQLKDKFPEKNIKYRLAAVMIHRGNTSHGHYWTYIQDFEKDIWRKYNDESVDEHKQLDDIFEARQWEQGTPTYAIYVRDEKKTEFIRPVCRAPEKLLTPEPSENISSGWEDVTMQNGESQAGIDPKLTVKDGGQASWDEQRKVPEVKWTPWIGNDGLVRFSGRRKALEREGSTSPKRRHDSAAASHEVQDAKHRRLEKDGGDAVERLVQGVDGPQLEGEHK